MPKRRLMPPRHALGAGCGLCRVSAGACCSIAAALATASPFTAVSASAPAALTASKTIVWNSRSHSLAALSFRWRNAQWARAPASRELYQPLLTRSISIEKERIRTENRLYLAAVMTARRPHPHGVRPARHLWHLRSLEGIVTLFCYRRRSAIPRNPFAAERLPYSRPLEKPRGSA